MGKRFHFFQILGFVLILTSLVLLLSSHILAQRSQTAARELTSKIESLLPDRSVGLPGSYSDPRMPVLQVSGQDVVGLLEAPGYGLTLPIGSDWSSGRLTAYPCRFHGSVYDSTMIIGGSDQAGQFDFFSRLDLGDRFRITDMLGTEFSYTVTRIDRAGSADYETLSAGGFPLTLFVRSAYSMEYILVRCDLQP